MQNTRTLSVRVPDTELCNAMDYLEQSGAQITSVSSIVRACVGLVSHVAKQSGVQAHANTEMARQKLTQRFGLVQTGRGKQNYAEQVRQEQMLHFNMGARMQSWQSPGAQAQQIQIPTSAESAPLELPRFFRDKAEQDQYAEFCKIHGHEFLGDEMMPDKWRELVKRQHLDAADRYFEAQNAQSAPSVDVASAQRELSELQAQPAGENESPAMAQSRREREAELERIIMSAQMASANANGAGDE